MKRLLYLVLFCIIAVVGRPQATTINVCYNGSKSYAVDNSNSSIRYMWLAKDQTASVWDTMFIWGANYSCTVSGITTPRMIQCVCDFNNDGVVDSIAINELIRPYAQLQPGSISCEEAICSGASTTISNVISASSPDLPITYQWHRSSSLNGFYLTIPSSNEESYTASSLSSTTYFYRTATNSCQTLSSNTVHVRVYPHLTQLEIACAGSNSICYGTTPQQLSTITDIPIGQDTFEFQWQQRADDSWNDILGATGTSYQPGTLYSSCNYRLRCVNYCDTLFSNEIAVVVFPELSAPIIGTSDSVCYGSGSGIMSILTMPTGGDENFTYQWQRFSSGFWLDINGANSTSYSQNNMTVSTTYRLKCISSCGQLFSNSVTISVYPQFTAPVISGNDTICNGLTPNNLSLVVPSTGGHGNISYQWQKKINNVWSDIYGATNTTFNPGPLTSSAFYRLKSTSFCGIRYSNEVYIHVYEPIVAGVIGNDQTICYQSQPDSIHFTQNPSGGEGVFLFNWEHSLDGLVFTSISSDNSFQPNVLTQTHQYRVIVASPLGCPPDTTNVITISVRDSFMISPIVGTDTICYGYIPNLVYQESFPLGGAAPYTYQWSQSSDGSNYSEILGENDANYQPSALSQTTYYRLTVTSAQGCGSLISNEIEVFVFDSLRAASISYSGTQTLCYDSLALPISILSYAQGGSDGIFVYQWQKYYNNEWIDLPGETSNTYFPGTLNVTTKYRIKCEASCGTVFSNEVDVNVYPRINAGAIGQTTTICYGTMPTPIQFETSPSGGGNVFSYCWEQSSDGIIFDSVGNLASFNPSVLTDTQYYRVIVTSFLGCACDTSNVVAINVREPFAVGRIAGVDTICFGTAPSTLTMVLDATGGATPYTYQWVSTTDTSAPYSAISAANQTAYQPSALNQTTYYRLLFSSAENCGVRASNPIEVFVYDSLRSAQVEYPYSGNICYDSVPVALQVSQQAEGGNGHYTYNWQINNGEWSDIVGANDTIYQPGRLLNNTEYRIKSMTGCGVRYSPSVTIGVYPQIDAGSLFDTSICYNSSAMLFFSENPSGGGESYAYIWEQSPDSVHYFTVAGASGNALITTPHTSDVFYRTIVVSTSGCSRDTTANIKVHVYNPFTVGSIMGEDTICYNTMPNMLNIDAQCEGGTIPYSYQWQSSSNGSDFVNINGAEYQFFQPGNLTQSTFYRLQFISAKGCGSLTSAPVRVLVYDSLTPAYISSNTNQTLCYDSVPQQIMIAINPTGGNNQFYHQWQWESPSGWNNIPGATAASYQPPRLTDTINYRLLSTSAFGCGITYSNNRVFNVYPRIQSGSITDTQTICYNTNPVDLTFSVSPFGGGNQYQYRWQSSEDGVNFTDFSAPSINGLQPGNMTETTIFRCVVSSSLGCSEDTTNTIQVIVRPQLIPPTIGDNSEVCYTDDANVLVTHIPAEGGSNNFTYQWQNSDDTVEWSNILEAVQTSYQPLHMLQTTFYRLKGFNMCGEVISNPVKIQVNPLPIPQSILGDTIVCQNQYELYSLDDMLDGFDYTWDLSDHQIGYIVSKIVDDTNEIEVQWTMPNSIDTLIMTVTNQITGCTHINKQAVFTGDTVTPDKTTIIRKVNSNILVAEESDRNLFYQWGFDDRQTGLQTIIEGYDYSYVKLPHEFDPVRYDYWLILRPNEKSSCYSISYYGHGSNVDIDQTESSMFKVVVPSLCRDMIPLVIDSPDENILSCDVFNSIGERVKHYSLGRQSHAELVVPISYSGLYIVRVVSGNKVSTHKVVVK